MFTFKFEGKQTDIIRQFIETENTERWILNNEKYYQEKKITIDKNGNVIKEKVLNTMSKYEYDKYIWNLKNKGYKERVMGVM